MTQADLIAALPAGRLPPSLMQLHATDILALVGAGLLLAAMLSLLMTLFAERRPSRRARIRATRGQIPQERALAVARILGHLPRELQATAYQKAPPLGQAEIERIALRTRARRP